MRKSFRYSIRKWSRRDLILLLERLGLYISSGLTLDNALKITSRGISNRQVIAINKICETVEAGGTLSVGLSTYIRIPATIIGIIGHGERSGKLSESLTNSQLLLEKEDELIKKCSSALAYPVCIGVFAVLITIGLVRGVMPQIIPTLKSLHVQLPILTRSVIFISDTITAYGLYILVGIIIIVLTHIYVYRKYPFWKRLWQRCIIHIPIIGNLIFSYHISLFLISCGTLIEAGLSSSDSYESSTNALSLLPLKEVLVNEINNIANGIPIGNALINIKNMPPHISPLICAGEASGTLGISLIRAANILDRDIGHTLKRITALIEPIMMAGMGCVVGAIALSIMMPIYNISKVLQH